MLRPRRRLGLLLGLAAAGFLLTGPARAGSATQTTQPSFADGVRAYEIGDYADAFRDWLPLAKAGDVAAMRNIGTLYRLGQGVARDPVQAASWYRKAADLGFARAQSNLGELYLTGEGVKRDAAEAARWFHSAASQGDGLAAFSLAQLYEKGEGVSRSLPDARLWYRQALADGYPPAAARLAALAPSAAAAPAAPPAHPAAPPVAAMPVAPSQAAPAQTAPAPAASAPAASAPAAGPETLASALPAARHGDAGAQYRLGIAFRDGAGVPPDPVRADLWLTLAARGGNAEAAAALAKLTPELTPAEQAAAARLLAAPQAGHGL